jgi:hypothetical protein
MKQKGKDIIKRRQIRVKRQGYGRIGKIKKVTAK